MKKLVILFIACVTLIHGETASLEERLNSLEKEVDRLREVEREVQRLREVEREVQRLPKVERDVQKLREVDIQHAARFTKVESRPSICNTTMYSFSTRLHEDTQATDAPTIFGTVDLNIGDGYDEFTGVFTAPQSGIYLLSVYGTPGEEGSGDGGPVFIKKNDEILCKMWLTLGNNHHEYYGTDTNGCTAIAELTPEDSVLVTGNSDNPAFIWAERGAGFVGHMVQPYCS